MEAVEKTDLRPASAEPWRQLIADMVLWLALVLLFLAFRITLFAIFHAESAERPTAQALLRCFEPGLRSHTCGATWGLLPSVALTLIGFIRPLGIWHQRVRRLTIGIVLVLCAVIFVTDVGYFAEYDSQFDHWIVGLVYDDRSAILTTIWKTYPVVLLILLGGVAVGLTAWALNKVTRLAAAADVPGFLGTKVARTITFIVFAIWIFVGAKVWLGKNLKGLKNAAATGDVFLNKIVLNPFFALRYAIWQRPTAQTPPAWPNSFPTGM